MTAEGSLVTLGVPGAPSERAEASCAPSHVPWTGQECSAEGYGPRQAPSLSPDAHTKGLISAINALQQQQERAEAARHASAEAAASAAAEAAELKAALHAVLRRTAELDDAEQAVQAELEARLQEQGVLADQLRLLSRRLATLRGADPCMQGACSCSGSADEASSAAERQHRLELQQKQEAAEGLRCKLLARGLGPGTLAALCSDAEHSAVAGGAAPAAQQQGGGNGLRKASWLGGGGGGGGGGGLLGSFGFRRWGS